MNRRDLFKTLTAGAAVAALPVAAAPASLVRFWRPRAADYRYTWVNPDTGAESAMQYFTLEHCGAQFAALVTGDKPMMGDAVNVYVRKAKGSAEFVLKHSYPIVGTRGLRIPIIQ